MPADGGLPGIDVPNKNYVQMSLEGRRINLLDSWFGSFNRSNAQDLSFFVIFEKTLLFHLLQFRLKSFIVFGHLGLYFGAFNFCGNLCDSIFRNSFFLILILPCGFLFSCRRCGRGSSWLSSCCTEIPRNELIGSRVESTCSYVE